MWVNNFNKKIGLNTASLFQKCRLTNSLVYGNIPMATFAKYDRSKPHINVGTIGK
jgi:hypothetical protein